MQLLKNITRVAMANIINFGSSFIVGFILPAYLSMGDYGRYKEYTLYLSFVYLFNLGFNDGIYIKYGGEDAATVDKKALHEEHNFISVFQLLVFAAMLLVSLVLQNTVLVLFSVATFFMTITTYHQNYAQAVGDFKLFSNGNIFKTIVNILTLLFALFFMNSRNYAVFILMNVLTNAVVYLLYEFVFWKQYGYRLGLNVKNNLTIFKIGIFILIANMSLTFVGNVGSWVVNFGFSVEEFAQYSFSTSVLNLILLIVNAVGMVFYNVISKNENQVMLKLTKRILLFLGIFGGLLFFVFKVIIETFLSQYNPAISLLSITFISIPYVMVTKIIIANLYKSRKNEKKYFRDVSSFAAGSFLLVGVVYLITENMTAIAFATTICYVLWFLYTTRKEYKYLKSSTKELLLLLSHFVVFYIAANVFDTLFGAVIYLAYIVVVMGLFRREFRGIIEYVKK